MSGTGRVRGFAAGFARGTAGFAALTAGFEALTAGFLAAGRALDFFRAFFGEGFGTLLAARLVGLAARLDARFFPDARCFPDDRRAVGRAAARTELRRGRLVLLAVGLFLAMAV